jgi:hypothetical protein
MKALLLDGGIVAELGFFYACEIIENVVRS